MQTRRVRLQKILRDIQICHMKADEDSENVVLFEIQSFYTRVIVARSCMKYRQNISKNVSVKKTYIFLKKILCQNLLKGFFKPNLETSLGRNIATKKKLSECKFFLTTRNFRDKSKISKSCVFEQRKLWFKSSKSQKVPHFWNPQDVSFHMVPLKIGHIIGKH